VAWQLRVRDFILTALAALTAVVLHHFSSAALIVAAPTVSMAIK
jgi:hypothetical protein